MRDRRWGGYRGYDAWFDAPINNAKLAATSVYSDSVQRLGAFDKARRAEARCIEAGIVARTQVEQAEWSTVSSCPGTSRLLWPGAT
ncbi:aminopeptidase [Mesorhizobium sp. M0323]|uniref:aminopeptidase n=1 Tax=Mesorhizobium sp. M0323 TaxID=2956938 RepID=UPI00333857D1